MIRHIKNLRSLLIASIIPMAVLGCSTDEESRKCPDANCNNYQTQSAAQSAFDTDRECMQALDDDNDGIACEHLISGGGTGGGGTGGGGTGGGGCPTTSNCGCSNKTKNQCESSCCKWVVGTGCVCK